MILLRDDASLRCDYLTPSRGAHDLLSTQHNHALFLLYQPVLATGLLTPATLQFDEPVTSYFLSAAIVFILAKIQGYPMQ